MGFKVCEKCGRYKEKDTTYCNCAKKEVKKLRAENEKQKQRIAELEAKKKHVEAELGLAQDVIEYTRAENKELVGALKPFAKEAKQYSHYRADVSQSVTLYPLLEWVRLAAELIEKHNK